MTDPSESHLPQDTARKERKLNAATGVSAASVRAIGSQALAFYFRAPGMLRFYDSNLSRVVYALQICYSMIVSMRTFLVEKTVLEDLLNPFTSLSQKPSSRLEWTYVLLCYVMVR